MSEQIQKGDVVYVARTTPCCNSDMNIGFIFTVTNLKTGRGKYVQCGHIHNSLGAQDESGGMFNVTRLKKIPPLSELETIRSAETISA